MASRNRAVQFPPTPRHDRETKAPLVPSRAGSHLFFRSTREAPSPDIQALLSTSALGIADVKPNEAFSIRLALVRPRSRGRIQITSTDPNAPLLIDPGYLSAEADLYGTMRGC